MLFCVLHFHAYAFLCHRDFMLLHFRTLTFLCFCAFCTFMLQHFSVLCFCALVRICFAFYVFALSCLCALLLIWLCSSFARAYVLFFSKCCSRTHLLTFAHLHSGFRSNREFTIFEIYVSRLTILEQLF